MNNDFRYAVITTCEGKVTSFSGWDTTGISIGMNETEALNKLGKKGFRPYKVTEREGYKGMAKKAPVYTTFRLCNQPLPQV